MEFEQKTLAKERQKLAATLASLESDQPLSSRELHAVWEQRARPFWRAEPSLYRALAAKCHRAGENFLAIEVAEEGLTWYGESLPQGEHLQLIHLCALAYSSVGAPEHAQELIRDLGPRRDQSAQALDLLAQTHRSWSEEAEDETSRREHLRQALAACHRALKLERTSRRAITAAGIALRLGASESDVHRREEARSLARLTTELSREEQRLAAAAQGVWDGFHWAAASAESALILGEFAAARAAYAEASECARHRRADLLTLRRQTRLLLAILDHDSHEFDAVFRLPRVGLFAGHMVDLPDHGPGRFAEENVQVVQARIVAALAEHDVFIGYGSAACGGDLLFLRAVLDRPGGEVHVVLPFERGRFLSETVVRSPAHRHWGEVFERVLREAASVTELADSPCWFEGNSLAFGNRVLHGLAERRAREFGDSLLTFAVWDGQPQGARLGGTADSVRRWAARGHTRVLIPPDGTSPRIETHREPHVEVTVLPVSAGETGESREDKTSVREEIHAILCGEWEPPEHVVRAGDRPTMEAVQAFFRRAGELIAGQQHAVVHRSVDGGRFRLIFDDLTAAGLIALALREFDLADRRLRLGLHAGPVARWSHPFLNNHEEPAGIQLQKAAQLALLPWSAKVYASREYAALLAASPAVASKRRLHCVYQGGVFLNQRFGRQEIFTLAE